ncbi:MAG TPA: NYN domain-containing protein [Thermoanaerobaculaceae bacterium]|nr:NYN domain-containing protein [Thermoanaerobaculaceae bacterium]HRS15752.1 NYN domain-containing protein [Thermoanaerobaculaceae bacterium]
MPWIVDGNNVAPGQNRQLVRQAALALARVEKVRIVVVFDGAPPAGSPAVERLGPVEVRYAPHADTAILDLLRRGGRGWRLASDDRSLGVHARDMGASVVSAGAFWAKVERAQASAPQPDRPRIAGGAETAAPVRLPDVAVRVRRSPRARRRW